MPAADRFSKHGVSGRRSIGDFLALRRNTALLLVALVLAGTGERFTLTELSAQTGLDADFALQVWRCAGFPEPRLYERRFGHSDVEVFRLFAALATFVDHDLVFQLARTIGEAVSRIAEAEVAMLRSNIEAPLVQSQRYVDVARLTNLLGRDSHVAEFAYAGVDRVCDLVARKLLFDDCTRAFHRSSRDWIQRDCARSHADLAQLF